MARIDIHDFPRKMQYERRRLARLKIPPKNKQLLLEFERFCITEGLSLPRRLKLLRHMLDVAREFITAPFRRVSKADIQEAVVRIEGRKGYSAWTKHDVKVAIRKFFKWIIYGDEALIRSDYPELVAWIKTTMKRKDACAVQAADLLTPQHVEAMLRATDSPRDRAFVALLYELGARVSEIGALKVGDITRDEYSFQVDLDGKTGKRTVRVVLYASHLVNWLDIHPSKEDRDSPLWPSRCRSIPLKPLMHSGIRCMIRKLAKKASVSKRVYPHLFRHSRATHLLATGTLNEAQAKVFFGWVPDSNILSTYAHLVTRDANDAILRAHGVLKSFPKTAVQARSCGMCHSPNEPTARFCFHCGYGLDISAVETAKKQIHEAETLLKQFLRMPKVVELFNQMILERDGSEHTDSDGPPSPAPQSKPPSEADGSAPAALSA